MVRLMNQALMPEIIGIASDHRGFAFKAKISEKLEAFGYNVLNLGAHAAERCDSQDYAVAMAQAIYDSRIARGILLCGTGNGMAIAANRFQHVRAALVHDATTARLAREHNHANVLVLGADVLGIEVVQDCVKAWLQAEMLGGRYAERIYKLNTLDPSSLKEKTP